MLKLLDNMLITIIYLAGCLYWVFKQVRKLYPVYLYCRYVHKGIRAEDGWLLNPFGIGGGHTVYYLSCRECGRVYWEIDAKEYRSIKEKDEK